MGGEGYCCASRVGSLRGRLGVERCFGTVLVGEVTLSSAVVIAFVGMLRVVFCQGEGGTCLVLVKLSPAAHCVGGR